MFDTSCQTERENSRFSEASKKGFLYQRALTKNKGRYFTVRDIAFLDFSTASYLGLDCDENFIQIVIDAAKKNGLGRCASPMYVAPEYYDVIETEIKRITGFSEVMLFSSASLANCAAVRYGLPAKCAIFRDEFCHRSLLEATKVRKSSIYHHLNISHLIEQIQQDKSDSRPAVITDGVFSMSGKVAPIQDIFEVIKIKNGYLLIDDAHGFAVDGKIGEGTIALLPELSKERVIYVGSLNKALPGFGGFIACSNKIAYNIKMRSPQYGFSCSIPLLYAASAAKCCTLIGKEHWKILVAKLKNNWKTLNQLISNSGKSLMAPYSPIAVLNISSLAEMRRVCIALNKERIAFNIVGFPAIPQGELRIRFCLSAAHLPEDIYKLGSVLTKTFNKI